MPGGQGEEVANASSGCAVGGEVVPDGLGRNSGAVGLDAGSSAGEDVGAGGGEVGVVLAVGFAVGRTIVAGGHGDRDAEGSGGLASGVDRLERLRGPVGFGGAPTE